MTPTAPIALVLCTHNPEPRCLERCLAALRPLLSRHPEAELVLVDNISSPPLAESRAVKELIQAQPGVRLEVEPRQGLCWARQRGVQCSTAPWVLFVDDDNELAPDYLDVLLAGIARHADVAAWGPGVIEVDFLDAVAREVAAHPEWFQQRRQPLAYGCQPGTWQSHYPNGSGFAIRRDVLESYGERLAAGTLTATGRSGTSMASAEDIQIVWQAIREGLAAGLLPDLRLNHLIPARKTSPDAIGRHAFGLSSSYYPALLECWPDQAGTIPAVPSRRKVLHRIVMLRLRDWLLPARRCQTRRDLGLHLGFACGLSAVHRDSRLERYLRWAQRLGVC